MIKLHIENFDIAKIADSGQCFRMNITNKEHTLVEAIAGDRRIEINDCGGNNFEFGCENEEFNSFWRDYFDIETDYDYFGRAIPEEDVYLLSAADAGRGIRILRQEPFETLISFIISQRKSIPAIKHSVEALCRLCGAKREGYNAFPTADAIASCTAAELAECSLGYRVPYILRTSELCAVGKLDLAAIMSLDDDELLETLMTAPGVGPKVANCVMLFAYHRLGAFPRDVWINRIIDTEYGGNFPLELYNGFGGVIQQYMFYYGRNAGR